MNESLRLVLNARFLTRLPTGVDRTASELASALARQQDIRLRGLMPDAGVAQPEGRRPELLKWTAPMTSGLAGKLTGHPWEQVALPTALDQDEWLLSLCNMGPLVRRRQVVMLHDAQVFRAPESYSRPFRLWYQAIQPWLGRRAGLVVTVSEYSRRELEHFGIVPPGKTKVIPNGADHILRITPDTETLSRHGLRDKGYLLAIGSIAPHKNLAMVSEAARARKNRSLPLVIAGGGNAQVFGAAGIAPSEDVRMLGRVSDPELRALYQGAAALVFPSFTEGFGLPPAEAMFCGCPVIASTGGAIPEVCGNTAIMLDPGDRDGWTVAMERIAAEPELRATLSQKGRETVSRFSWENSARTLLEHLAQVDRDGL